MPIYTKTGDAGETALFGGKRVPKSHPVIEVNGTIDELSSAIGMAISYPIDRTDISFFQEIQSDLYTIMALLSHAPPNNVSSRLSQQTTLMEQDIDKRTHRLPPLSRFILPGGTPVSAQFHVARTICRRTERLLVTHAPSLSFDSDTKRAVFTYINRLSDLLFTVARFYNETPLAK